MTLHFLQHTCHILHEIWDSLYSSKKWRTLVHNSKANSVQLDLSEKESRLLYLSTTLVGALGVSQKAKAYSTCYPLFSSISCGGNEFHSWIVLGKKLVM